MGSLGWQGGRRCVALDETTEKLSDLQRQNCARIFVLAQENYHSPQDKAMKHEAVELNIPSINTL